MATALKTPPAGMTGAVRSLQWTIQDLNGSVEHLGQSHDHLRRAQNMMAWTTGIFGALLLSGLVWIANDIFHVKDQMSDTERRFDGVEAQMTALGTRLDDLNLTIEQVGAELLASRGIVRPDSAAPEVSVLSTPNQSANLQAAANPPLEAAALDAAAQPAQAAVAPAAPAAPVTEVVAAPVAEVAAPAPALTEAVAAAVPANGPEIALSPPAPRDQLTPAELAQQSPVVIATAPAAAAPAAAAPAAEAAPSTVAAAAPAPAEEAPAPVAAAAPAAAPAGADLSDDQLLSYNDDQVDPGDELLLLDENGNPQ